MNIITQNDELLNLSTLQQKIFEIIKLNLQKEGFSNISTNTKLLDIMVDSITFIQTIISLEETFNFEFDDEMLLIQSFQTIKSIIEYVEIKVLKMD